MDQHFSRLWDQGETEICTDNGTSDEEVYTVTFLNDVVIFR